MNFAKVTEEQFRRDIDPSAIKSELKGYPGVNVFKIHGVICGIEDDNLNRFYTRDSIFGK